MKVISNYISQQLHKTIITVIVSALTLVFFLEMIAQIQVTHSHDYKVHSMINYCLLLFPRNIEQIGIPTALLATFLSISRLADKQELFASHACGLSTKQIMLKTAPFTLILLIMFIWVGEFFGQSSEFTAKRYKAAIIHQTESLPTAHGLWIREHNNMIWMQEIHDNNDINGFIKFHRDNDGMLKSIVFADKAIKENDSWQLIEPKSITLNNEKILLSSYKQNEEINLNIKDSLLQISKYSPESQTFVNLFKQSLRKSAYQRECQYYLVKHICAPFIIIFMWYSALYRIGQTTKREQKQAKKSWIVASFVILLSYKLCSSIIEKTYFFGYLSGIVPAFAAILGAKVSFLITNSDNNRSLNYRST